MLKRFRWAVLNILGAKFLTLLSHSLLLLSSFSETASISVCLAKLKIMDIWFSSI